LYAQALGRVQCPEGRNSTRVYGPRDLVCSGHYVVGQVGQDDPSLTYYLQQ